MKNPFPIQTRSGMVVNEVCACGHLRNEHRHTMTFGHGGCNAIVNIDDMEKCDCAQFTFKKRLYK